MALAYLHFSEKQKLSLILIVTFLNCGGNKQVHYVNINKFDSSLAVYQ